MVIGYKIRTWRYTKSLKYEYTDNIFIVIKLYINI